jgi:hypothetical protein
MIQPTHDVELINRIANSDEVRPFISVDGRQLDFAALADRSTRTGVVALTNGDDAVALFEMTADRTYQSHTLFAKTCRGRKAIDTARAMVAWMFLHGADVVWGDTPLTNRAAILFNRLIGAREVLRDESHVIFELRKPA